MYFCTGTHMNMNMKQNMNIGFVQTNLACNCLQEQLKNIAKIRVQHVNLS